MATPTISRAPFKASEHDLMFSLLFGTTLPAGTVKRCPVDGLHSTHNLLYSILLVTQGAGNALPDQTGHTGQYLTTDGTTASWAAIPSTTPAGPPGAIQFNDSGAFGGSALLAWDTPTAVLTVAGRQTLQSGTLTGTNNALNITATMPAVPGATTYGIDAAITSDGSAANSTAAMRLRYLSGYTGSASTWGLLLSNGVLGTGSTLVPAAASNTQVGNFGLQASSSGTTSGLQVGVSGQVSGGNANVGVAGLAQIPKNSAVNIGVMGSAINTGTSPVQVGGWFHLNQTSTISVSAALVADNGSQTSAIFLARDNGSTVFTIADGGGVTGTNLLTITQATANTGILASTGYSLTGSNATNMLDFAGTWNTSGNPTALKIAISNTASGATAKFLNFLAGASGTTSVFSVDKAGVLAVPGGTAGAPAINFGGDVDTGLYSPAGGYIILTANGTAYAGTSPNGYFVVFNNKMLSFDASVGDGDLFLIRKAAAALQMGKDAAGATAQLLTAGNRITSDGSGSNLTLAAGNGLGAAAGNLILSSWTTAGTGVAGTLTTIATVNITGLAVASGKKLTLGNAATTGLSAGVVAALTNATIVITDSGGQDYRIPCII